MEFRRLAILAVAFVAVIAVSASALAGSPANTIVAKAPFEFTAGDKSLPAGTYRITIHLNGDKQELQIRSDEGSSPMTLVPVTRLARQHVGDAPKASLVFDTSEGQNFLSEVWFRGADGFLLRATKEEHKHAIVEVKN